jgi:hypothetical protein
VLNLVYERAELEAVLPAFESDTRVHLQDRNESVTRFACSIAKPAELLKVTCDVPLMPGEQDRLDTRENL